MISPSHYIFSLLKYYKISLLILLIHPFFTAFSLIFPTFIIKNITDAFLIIDKELGFSAALKWIVIYFIIINILFIYRRIYQYVIKIKLFPMLSKNTVLDCVSSLIDNSKSFFYLHPAGEIAHFLIHLNENLIDFITLFFEKVLPNLLSFIFIITYFFYYNIYCGITMLSWTLLNIILGIYIISDIKKLSKEIVFNKSLISKCIVDLFNNIALVQVFSKQNYEIDILNKKTNFLVDNEKSINWSYFKIYACYYISFFIMQAISLYILLHQYRLGIITVSDIIFWWTLSGISASITDNLINDILQIPKYFSGISEGLEVLKHQDNTIIKNKKLIFKEGKIEFKNVYFSFQDTVILENFSLTITSKEKVAIVGLSGSGKTTLIFLLLRMYRPDKGAIYIDDQNIADLQTESLYSIFSVIFQENHILDRSILENILYSEDNKKACNREKLYQIISLAGLSEFKNDSIESLHNIKNIDSKVLSGGQKQRISIARALYKNSDIFLLDEPTSSLDEITEDIIINSIRKITEDKTLIIITHKLNIVKTIPRILVFDKGKVIEEGSHESLINQDGLYKKLCDLSSIL
jgi:ATP-binding cassette subfamily B protein